MTTFRTLATASILISITATAGLSQTDQAEPVRGPLSTETAPNITAVGQTKPPSRDASPTAVKPIERLTPRQASDDAITAKVCVGCRAGTATAESLSLRIRPSETPETRAGHREAPPPAPEPRRQSDLDTVALASAHRERAESVQEKTNGLWQSWLVSVCDGCGDQKPAKALKLEDWPNRDVPLTTGSVDRKASPEKASHAETKRVEIRRRGSLEADLSPEHVAAIRRMPQ